MANLTRPGLESSHLWLCDGRGDVYVLRDVDVYTEALKISLTSSEAAAPPPNWLKVGNGFSLITAGYSGLVCGIKKPDLCVRLGVTHDNPSGVSWSKVICRVNDVIIGNHFIVRKTFSNTLFFTDMTEIDMLKSKSLLVLNWHSIPSCPEELWGNSRDKSKSTHTVLDEKDRLFLVDSLGEVCMYSNFGASDATWCKVCSMPSVGSSQSVLGWLAFWREDEQPECLFKRVSAGKRSLWCLDSKPGVAWQLVLSDVITKDGKWKLKTNWNKCALPIEDISNFSADKCKADGLMSTIVCEEDSTAILYCSLDKNTDSDSGPVEISAPLNWSSACQSISMCRTSVDSSPSGQSTITGGLPAREISSLYPDLKQEHTDICCENGDCSFCRQAAENESRNPLSFLEPFEEEEEEPRRKIGEKRQRHEPEGDGSDPEETGLYHVPKRAHISNLNRYSLLEGVDVVYRKKSLIEKHKVTKPSELEVPLTVEQLEQQFDYPFELEHKILHCTHPDWSNMDK